MRRTARRLGGLVVAALVLGAVSGCVGHKVQGDTITYTYETWVAVVGLLGAGAAGLVGWLLCDFGSGSVWSYFSIKRTGWVLMISAPVAVTFFLPAVFTHYVKVDDYHFEAKGGWWWSPDKHSVRFDQLERIEYTVERRETRDGPSYSYSFDCVSHSGEVERVPIDTLMRAATDEILKRAKDRGVKVVGLDDEDDEEGDGDKDGDGGGDRGMDK